MCTQPIVSLPAEYKVNIRRPSSTNQGKGNKRQSNRGMERSGICRARRSKMITNRKQTLAISKSRLKEEGKILEGYLLDFSLSRHRWPGGHKQD